MGEAGYMFCFCQEVAVSPYDGFTSALVAFMLASCRRDLCIASVWLTCAGRVFFFHQLQDKSLLKWCQESLPPSTTQAFSVESLSALPH